MKTALLSSILLFSFIFNSTAQTDTKTKTKAAKQVVKGSVPEFKNLLDSFSYAAGFNVATNMQAQGIARLNTALMNKGIEDVFNKVKPILTQEVINACMQSQLDIFAAEKAASEKKAGVDFLAANAKRPGVITLPSGLQYEVIKNGEANSATPRGIDTVEVNYIGKLIDGTEFDNSFKRGEAAAFPVMGVIKGWIEILQLMRKADQWKVFIPSELAYGAGGAAGGAIPPNSVLVFEITLEGIRPAVSASGN